MANSQALQHIQDVIRSKHRLNGGLKEYKRRFAALYGAAADKTDTLGTVPEGFAPICEWDRQQFEQVNLSIFINAADPTGAVIAGAKAEDRITITSASGLASFTKAKPSIVPSFVGFVAAIAGGVVVQKGGDSETTQKIVEATEQCAEQLFKDDDVNKFRRNAFGFDPGVGKFALREGGVLVTLPAAGGPYYSGVDFKFSLKSEEAHRTDSQKPAHVEFGFFLVQGNQTHNSRRVGRDGEIYINAWDHRFDDNIGHYHVRLALTRDGVPPIVVE